MVLREAVHQAPAWRDKSNFIIATRLESSESGLVTEQLWARQTDGQRYELCCIPFFAYDLALGDIVEVDEDYLVTRVVERSGRYVFRVWLGQAKHPPDDLERQLAELGALIEWSSANLFAVDAPDLDGAQKIADFLHECDARGHLMYETGKSA